MAVLPRRRSESDFSIMLEVRPVPEAVPHTRHAVANLLMSRGLADICDDAVLCVSEAVTNSLTHARPSGTVMVRILRDLSRLRIEIADADRTMTEVRNGNPADASECPAAAGLPNEHGWGLQIVGALSSRWGIDADDTGKRVWFEIDIPAIGHSGAIP